MTARILVAEDDPKQRDLLRLYLEREGYSVVDVADGRAAVEMARQRQPDLIILDVMMPHVDGLDVCRILRFESDVPIILVTARSAESDMLLGLDLGADDYVVKPFSPRELMARVRTVLRRTSRSTPAADVYQIRDLAVDTARHEVRLGNQLVDLTPKEFAVLAELAAHPGVAYTRQRLLDAAFGFDYGGFDRTIDVHIANLRKKIEADPANPQFLLTVYGVGYKMVDQ